MRGWQNPAPGCRRCKQMYITRALQAAAFFTPGLLLPSLETSFYGVVLTILHPQFSCLETTGTICLAFLIIKSTKMIFPLTASLPAGGRSSLFNHTPPRLREFPVHLIRFRIGPFWSSHECFFRLQYSQGTSRVKPAGLQGKGRSFFLPIKSCGMA